MVMGEGGYGDGGAWWILTPALLVTDDIDTTKVGGMSYVLDPGVYSSSLGSSKTQHARRFAHDAIAKGRTPHLLTCSTTGSVVGLTMWFCTTATLTSLGALVCSWAAVILYAFTSKSLSSPNFRASSGIGRTL